MGNRGTKWFEAVKFATESTRIGDEHRMGSGASQGVGEIQDNFQICTLGY